MSGLPKDQKARLEHAARAFCGRGAVRVTPEKLHAFLDATRDLDMPASSRLRWLAIALESLEFEQGWQGLRAIYQAAAEADPADALVLHSWGISATNWAEEWMTPGPADRVAIAAEAERVLRAALGLRPRDSRVAHALGLLSYAHPARGEDPQGYRARAIDWFSRAVAWDPGNSIAQLYLAHCFHDAEDWPRAIAAYGEVDLDRLARDWPAWRAVKCREQLAQCYAGAGDKGEATRRFTAFLDEVASWDDRRVQECLVNVDELVAAVTSLLDDPELRRRTRALVDRLGLRKRYRGFVLDSEGRAGEGGPGPGG